MNINSLSKNFLVLNKLLPSLWFVFLCFITSSVFSQQLQQDSIEKNTTYGLKEIINTDSLLHFAERYLGTPYKIAGKNAKGFDCSGFVHHVYQAFNVKVPYSCPAISSVCTQKIDRSEVQKGDLLFFKGSNIKSKSIGHIAIVHTVDETGIKMIHSCRRGVILENLNGSKYYQARYLFAKRIL